MDFEGHRSCPARGTLPGNNGGFLEIHVINAKREISIANGVPQNPS